MASENDGRYLFTVSRDINGNKIVLKSLRIFQKKKKDRSNVNETFTDNLSIFYYLRFYFAR